MTIENLHGALNNAPTPKETEREDIIKLTEIQEFLVKATNDFKIETDPVKKQTLAAVIKKNQIEYNQLLKESKEITAKIDRENDARYVVNNNPNEGSLDKNGKYRWDASNIDEAVK